MLFFKGKDDMGLEASLKLLDLSPDATVDDANQAYAYLHRMIDLFYRDTESPADGNLQDDMDILTCAYEKAVAYLSDPTAERVPVPAEALQQTAGQPSAPATDLHFTINFGDDRTPSGTVDDAMDLPAPNARTVREAIDITRRRLGEVESVLPQAHQAVETATAAATAARQRHERARAASVNAMVNAKAAKTRALLLEVDAKRAMEAAIAVAKKARDRVTAAREAAREAMHAAKQARQQADQVKKSEETAAAEAICADDRLEQARSHLNRMTLNMVEIRKRMNLFQNTGGDLNAFGAESAESAPTPPAPAETAEPSSAADRQQVIDDLLAIEASLKHRERAHRPESETPPPAAAVGDEKRTSPRIVYPRHQRPRFTVDGRSIEVIDLSSAGMRLTADDALTRSRIVRGAITIGGRQPLPVTGRVVRQDDSGFGMRLVTRIGNHLLEQERRRLSA